MDEISKTESNSCPRNYRALSIQKTDQKSINVYYSSLNFWDIMLGTSNGLHVNEMIGTTVNEFVGRIHNGKRVVGIVQQRGTQLAPTVIANSDLIWLVPDHWSMEEAVTVPVAYCTAYYALVVKANIEKGKTVLIHSGNSDVGLAAIRIARNFGCDVYTTVDTEEQKMCLDDLFGQKLSIISLPDSKDISFDKSIMVETNNKGFDVIVNCLAEKKLNLIESSIKCIAEHGTFLEMNKNIKKINSKASETKLKLFSFFHFQEKPFLFSKDIVFHQVCLDKLFENNNSKNESDKLRIHNYINLGIKSGAIVPLRRTIFNLNQREEAFRFMSSEEHIGKVIIKLRDE